MPDGGSSSFRLPTRASNLKFFQGPDHSADGQPHDIIKITFDAADADHANPFLDGIRAGFVKGLVAVDIAFDLGGCQVVEPDRGRVGEGSLGDRLLVWRRP